MLSLEKGKNGRLIAQDKHLQVYLVPEEEYPKILPKGNALQLLDNEILLKEVFRKYRLKKEDIKMITSFYSQSDTTCIDVENWSLRQAFEKIEQLILRSLKTEYIVTGAKLFPHFSGRIALAVLGKTNTGKSFMSSEIKLT